jgi:hypothetical protein
MKLTSVLILIFIFSGCARSPRKVTKANSVALLKRASYFFRLQENSGEYFLKKENGWTNKNNFTTRRELKDADQTKTLEKSISFSKSGNLKNGLKILRPDRSQYVVWFNKKKYSTITKVNERNKSIEVIVNSPEARWKGKKEVAFPSSTMAYCYFYQVIECAANMGFIQKAPKLSQMMLDFYIIWEGYPFIQEQYAGLPNNVFTKASLSYDGKNDNGDMKFSLRFNDQMIAYVIDRKFRNYRMFWVSQGLATTLQSVK